MKNRFFCICILIFALCLLFASCGRGELKTNAEADRVSSADTDVVNVPETQGIFPEEADAPQSVHTEKAAVCSVDFVREETAVYDDSGKLLLLSGQLIYPVVSLPENEAAEKAINAYFVSEREKYLAEADKMHADSLELLGNFESDYWNTFIYDKSFALKLVNSSHLSFLCHTDIYLGGAHPTPDESGVIFDLTDGHVLTMDELFTDTDAMREHVLPMIKDEVEDGFPFENYEESLPDLVDEGTFFLDSEGVTFICNVYVLFPYVNGISYYNIPYEKLEGHLNFEPTESESFSRFYSFDIDGEDSEDVLGYVDTREFSCPYDETAIYAEYGDVNVCYVIPKYVGSNISVIQVLYDENGNEIGTKSIESYFDTGKDFCLMISCPMPESKPLYRVVIDLGGKSASFDLIYEISTEKPVKLIK